MAIIMKGAKSYVPTGGGGIVVPPVYSHLFYGYGATPVTEADILAGISIQIVSGADIGIDFRPYGNIVPWMAQLLTEPPKTYVFMAVGNEFTIAPNAGIERVVPIGNYGLYAWAFNTSFVNVTNYRKN